MHRKRLAVALAIEAVAFSACGAGDAEDVDRPGEQSAAGRADSLTTDTSPEGRVRFGCAFERGIADADATTRHYGHIASAALFRAALEADTEFATAAQLWNASDKVQADDNDRRRSALFDLCSAAGFENRAGLPEMRSYMCVLAGDLARERPQIDSYGPESTEFEHGDPRRSDAEFVGGAHFLLALKEDPGWYDIENPWVALDDDDTTAYVAALQDLNNECATDR